MSGVCFGSVVMLIYFHNMAFPEVFYIHSVNLPFPQNFITVVNYALVSARSGYTYIAKQNFI